MYKYIIIPLLCLFSCTSKSTQLDKDRETYIDSLKRELVELKKQMPYEDMKGNWMWSIDFSNDTIFLIRKIDSSYVTINFKKVDMMNHMAEEYLKNMANRLETNDINLMQKYGIYIQCQFWIKDTDSLLYKQIITPEELSKAKALLPLEKMSGISPLSYYNALFEQLNGGLPKVIDKETTLIRIRMKDNQLYYEYEIIDKIANNFEEALKIKTSRDMMKKELLSYYRNYLNQWSADTRSDFKTYNIMVHFCYYTKKSKKIGEIILTADEISKK